MDRGQAKIWAKLSKSELQSIDCVNLAKWYKELNHFADGGDIECKELGVWMDDECPTFDFCEKYRIKTKTHIVNGFEVPAPIRKYTGQKTIYFPSFSAQAWCAQSNSKYRTGRLISRGVAFETAEEARANTMAMLGIDPSTYKEQTE